MAGMLGVSLDVLGFRQVWQRSTGVKPRLTRQPVSQPVIQLAIQSVSTASLFSPFFLSTTARPFDPF
jgi:hypothetical protein